MGGPLVPAALRYCSPAWIGMTSGPARWLWLFLDTQWTPGLDGSRAGCNSCCPALLHAAHLSVLGETLARGFSMNPTQERVLSCSSQDSKTTWNISSQRSGRKQTKMPVITHAVRTSGRPGLEGTLWPATVILEGRQAVCRVTWRQGPSLPGLECADQRLCLL